MAPGYKSDFAHSTTTVIQMEHELLWFTCYTKESERKGSYTWTLSLHIFTSNKSILTNTIQFTLQQFHVGKQFTLRNPSHVCTKPILSSINYSSYCWRMILYFKSLFVSTYAVTPMYHFFHPSYSNKITLHPHYTQYVFCHQETYSFWWLVLITYFFSVYVMVM